MHVISRMVEIHLIAVMYTHRTEIHGVFLLRAPTLIIMTNSTQELCDENYTKL